MNAFNIVAELHDTTAVRLIPAADEQDAVRLGAIIYNVSKDAITATDKGPAAPYHFAALEDSVCK